MQLNSSAPASLPAPATARPDAPARDRIRPLLGEGVGTLIPDMAFNARIGKGTVASEFDRSIRLRFDGDGPASTRTITPETTTAQRLFASPAGPTFERLIRRAVASTDPAQGVNNIHHITLVPDEHSLKGVAALSEAIAETRTTGKPVRYTSGHWSKADLPAAELRAQGRANKAIAAWAPTMIGQGTRAWNGDGEIVVTPDVSRELLAAAGAYRPQAGDTLASRFGAPAPELVRPDKQAWLEDRIADVRQEVMRSAIGTVVHEAHHSVSPMKTRGSEDTSIIEEAVSTIFGTRDRAVVERSVGLDTRPTALDPTGAVDQAKLGWKAWNRDQLPTEPESEASVVQGRYVDGPQIVRDLLKVFDVDLRTKAGSAEAFRLLQTKPSRELPRFLANELIARHKLDPANADKLTDRIRRSVSSPSGAGLVTKFLTELGVTG